MISTKEGLVEMTGTVDELLQDYAAITRSLAKAIDSRVPDKGNLRTVFGLILLDMANILIDFIINGDNGMSEVRINEIGDDS